MRRPVSGIVTILLSVVCVLAGAPHGRAGAQEPPRVGWEEPFDDIARWEAALLNPNAGSPVASVTAEDGCIRIVTQCGALDPRMKRDDWPEWPKNPASSFTNFAVSYDDVVDFDTYRYLVIRIREKATFFYLSINGKALKVGYTTGIHAQDLRTLGLTGKQKVGFYGQFLNSSGHVKIDAIRLVRELTDDEKAGFIADGLTVRDEKLTGHPYHKLEALNARAGRPARKPDEGSEWVVYRDVGTGAEVWRMTDLPTDEHQVTFNCDGSAFTVHGRPGSGFHVFDWTDRRFKFVEGGLRDAAPRFSTTECDVMILAENTWLPQTDERRPRRITLQRHNFRTGERTPIASFEPKTWIVQELFSSPDSSKMVFGLRESPVVFLIDPEVPDIDRRVREIRLPTRLKGVCLANSDAEIQWHNCYTYQPWIMDLKTGQVTHGNSPCAGGHSAGGPHWTIGPYSGLMKLLVRNGLHPQTEATADDTRIFANYTEPVATDYGQVSADGNWMVTDGVAGDVQGQHLMIAINDPATVLHVCHHNTSRNDWVTNTYSSTSPDTTKLAWVSDQLGTGDIYMAVTGRPAPPRNLVAKTWPEVKDLALLTWEAPQGRREIAGYRVYGSARSGSGFVPLHNGLVPKTNYTVKTDPYVYFLVAAVEPSGIEGDFSNEVTWRQDDRGPRTAYVEAEEGSWKPPLRLVLHGDASGSRCVRYHRASPDEPAEGVLKYKLALPPGRLTVWLRCRHENKPENWHWQRTTHDPRTGEIRIAEDGFAVDRIALSSDPNFDPNLSDAVTATPDPATDLRCWNETPQSVQLQWNPSRSSNVVRYDVHVGDDPKKLGNETIIASVADAAEKTQPFDDWGLRPGTAYTYHVVAVDSRGRQAKPVSLTVTTKPEPVQTIAAGPQQADGKVSFPIDVAGEAPFMLWVKYQPAYVEARQLRVGVEIDGRAAGTWQLRAPYRPMGGVLVGPGKGPERIFVDKVLADGKDVFDLAPGRHTVTFTLDPKLGAEKHKLMELTASNDHSWRPEGYDPRADFKKSPGRD